MTEPAQQPEAETDALDREVEQAIAACGGDVRAALKAALVANSFLMAEIEQFDRVLSVGFTRGRSPARLASRLMDDWREMTAGQPPESE